MSNKTEDFLTDMTEESTEIVDCNKQMDKNMREESTENSNTQIYQEGFYCILPKSIKNKQ